MASIFNIYIEQGSDFQERIDVTGDYTGYTIRGNIIDSTGTTTSNIASWYDAETGVFDISVSNANTALMATGIGKYDIEVVSGSGVVDKIIKGRVYVDGEVTI